MDLIIGAGVTGLAYAARTTNDYLIIEADNEIGGYCRTIKQNGFIWDYSGHFFHFRNESIKDYVFKNMVKADILNIIKSTGIYHNGVLVNYPFQKNIHQLSKQELINCLYDLFNNDTSTYNTFKEMLYAKFGRSIAELFLIPYNEKLYACDLNKLDVDAMGRFFPYANKEEIIANFHNSDDHSYNDKFVYPKGGAIEYIKSICKGINPDAISLNERLLSIDTNSKVAFTSHRSIHFDNLISTIPFPQLLQAVNIAYDKDLYTANKVLVFNLGFDAPCSIKKHWIYFADPSLVFYRVGFYNNIFGSEKMSLYVEIGLQTDAQFNETELLNKTIDDLKRVGIVTDHNLIEYKSVLMNPAYVHVTKQMEADRKSKMENLSKSSIYSIGRYGAWYYCSIEDNINEAFVLADKLCNTK